MARVSFLLQGMHEEQDHYGIVNELLHLEALEACLISIAFINSSGVRLLLESLVSIKDKMQLYIGVRNGITSYQALKILLDNGITPICVDTATQNFIFHPKVYLAYNSEKGILISGSANFTPGGLIKNIEASTITQLNVTDSDDAQLIHQVENSFQTLYKEHMDNCFLIENMEQLDAMAREGIIVDEAILTYKTVSRAKEANERETIRGRMRLKTRSVSSGVKPRHYRPEAGGDVSVVSSNLLWISGPLSRRDLNIPTSSGTNPTGSMLLKQGNKEQDINFQHYFRDEAFKDADWVFDSNPRTSHYERANIKFNIIIKGIHHGIHTLKVSNNSDMKSTTYLQKNAMTQIHWGDVVKSLIAKEDLLDSILSIYGPEEGSDIYTLSFD